MFLNTSFGQAGFISAGSLAMSVTRAAKQNFEFVTTHAAAFDRDDPEDMARLEALVKEGIHRASNLDPDAEPPPVTGSLFGANELIVCSELVTPEAIALATSEGFEPDEIEIHRRSVCDPLQIGHVRQFDLGPALAVIEAPVAVVAGRHDPTLYRGFAQRDAQLLRERGVDAVYLEAQEAGHDTLFAQAGCIASKLATFWDGDALQEDACAFSLADLVGPFE
jgi:pimeloyl-ACP methyl ester carboxylesterase